MYALLAILMILGPVLYTIAGILISRKILHSRIREGHNDVCVPIFLNAGVLFAVLLGFMVVAVWESYDNAKTIAATEATSLVPLYRAAGNLPPEAGDKIRALVREYIHQVIEDEWPQQATTGQASSQARKQIGDLYRAFGDGTITTQMKKDFPLSCNVVMQSITEVSTDRNKRNLAANEDIPSVMWFTILGGSLVIVTMGVVIYMERPFPHILMASLMSALIGLLLYSCLILSRPFQGPIAITPESFEKTLVILDDVDRGN